MKSIVTILVTVIILVTAQSCRKERMGNCSGCSQQQVENGCTTVNNYITVNDTVNTFINGVLTTVVVNHTNILQVVKTCPDGSSTTNNTNQGGWSETIYSNQNTGGGGTNTGLQGYWFIKSEALGLTSSNWISSVGATQIVYTGSCWQKQSNGVAINLSQNTWESLHNYCITANCYGLAVMVTGTDNNGYDILSYEPIPLSTNLCQ